MSELTIDRSGGGLGRASLGLGLLAPMLFFLGTVTGVFWFLGAIVGLAAVLAGVQALRKHRDDRADRRLAIAGLVLGAAIAGWFVVYVVLDAAAGRS